MRDTEVALKTRSVSGGKASRLSPHWHSGRATQGADTHSVAAPVCASNAKKKTALPTQENIIWHQPVAAPTCGGTNLWRHQPYCTIA